MIDWHRTFRRRLVADIVSQGTLAPSPHNLQGWRFLWRDGVLRLSLDPARRLPALDPTDREAYIGLGAAIENVRVAAGHFGYQTMVDYFPEGPAAPVVAALRFIEATGLPDDGVFPLLARRATNRRPFRKDQLEPATLARLQSALAGEPDFTLHLLTAPAKLAAAARLIELAERTRYENPAIHGEIYSYFRFTGRQARAHRDGLAFETAEVTAWPVQIAASLVLKPPVRRVLGKVGLNAALAQVTYNLARQAPVIGLLTARRADTIHYLRGGEVFERLWLAATGLDLALHVTNGPTELVHALKTGHQGAFSPLHQTRLADLRRQLYTLFPVDDRSGLLVLCRLGRADPPSARSLRRPVEDVLTFAD